MRESARLRIINESLRRENAKLKDAAEERHEIRRRLNVLERQVADLLESIGLEPTRKLVTLTPRKPPVDTEE